MRLAILRDTAFVAILTIVAKIAGALKTVVAARFFGAGNAIDAYLVAFLVPSFLGDVLAGALTAAFMPVLVEVRATSGQVEERRLTHAILIVAASALAGIALLAAGCATPLLSIIGSSFTGEKLHLTRNLLFIMLPILPLSGINVTLRTVLNSRERFGIAALTPICTPAATIVSVLLFGSSWGVIAMAIGSTAGVLAETVSLCLSVRRDLGSMQFSLTRLPVEVSRVFRQYPPVALNSLLLGGSSAIDQAMAASLGAGAVSALNYGTRLTGVLLAVGPAALATTIFPRLSSLAARKQWSDFRRIVRESAIVSIIATVPLTAVLIFNSHTLVRLIFERGAFTARDSMLVGQVQAYSLLQIPFSVLLMLFVRVVSSLRANQILLWLALVTFAANVALDLALMRTLGVAGIALSTAGVHVIALLFLAWVAFQRFTAGSQSYISNAGHVG